MDSFELNKIAGALLFTLLLVMGLGFLAELLYTPPELQQAAYVIDVPEEQEAGGAAEEAEAEPLPVVLAAGEVDAGQSQARKCAACHTFEEGEANKIGPNLHGVVGRQIAAVENFAYSDAMAEEGAAGETWTYENLYAFLEAPKSALPGTAMAFAGLKKPGDRADMIAYLRSVSPDAPPLPEPEPAQNQAEAPAPEGGDAAPAEGGGAAPAGETQPAGGEAQPGAAPSEPAPGGATVGEGAQTAPEASPGAPAPQNEAPADQPQ